MNSTHFAWNERGEIAWFYDWQWVKGATCGNFVVSDEVWEGMCTHMLLCRIDGLCVWEFPGRAGWHIEYEGATK